MKRSWVRLPSSPPLGSRWLSNEQLGEIDRLVPSLRETRSSVVQWAIEMYLYRIASERDAVTYDATTLSEGDPAADRVNAIVVALCTRTVRVL